MYSNSPQKRIAVGWLIIGLVLLGLWGCGRDLKFNSPEERIAAGERALRSFDFERAYAALNGVSDELEAGSEIWAKAAFLEATAARHVRPPTEKHRDRAASLYGRIAETRDGPLARLSLLDMARTRALFSIDVDPDDEEIRDLYREIVERWPDSREADVATLWLANSYLLGNNPLEDAVIAEELLVDRLDAQPDSPVAPVLWQILAEIRRDYLDRPQAALEAYREVAALGFPKEDKKDQHLFAMARLADRLGRPEEAAEMYARLLIDTPRSSMGWYSRERIIALNEENPGLNAPVPDLGVKEVESEPQGNNES